MPSEPFSDVLTAFTGAIPPTFTPRITFPPGIDLSWELLHIGAQAVSVALNSDLDCQVQLGGVNIGFVELGNPSGKPTSVDISWDATSIFPPNTAVVIEFDKPLPVGVYATLTAQARIL